MEHEIITKINSCKEFFHKTSIYARYEDLNAFYKRLSSLTTKLCIGHSDAFIDKFYNTIIQAQNFIDITTLELFPDIRYLAALRNGLTYLAANVVDQ